MEEPTNGHSIDQLLQIAQDWSHRAGETISSENCALKVRLCLDMARVKLATAEQEIRSRQIDLTHEANYLSEKLLKSNEEASKQSEENAKSMNLATKQLANSTKWLTIATCGLVLFAAVQAFIAFLALYKN